MTGLQRIHNYFSQDPVEFARQVQEFERNVEEALVEDFVTGRFVVGAVTTRFRPIRIIVEQQGLEGVTEEGTVVPVTANAFYLIGVTYRGVKSSGGGVTINVEDTDGNELFRVSNAGDFEPGDNLYVTSTALVRVPTAGFSFIYDAAGSVTTGDLRGGQWFAQKVAG